ncbi:aminoglycoside phosphotransferase family protein [Sansalvadorimonas sp. 2012CJ34-2]|uniref:Aminoglycoside phosphotransferase family protein n=1 Tax=Parendozoicomonas callyspongiae TaxID=2942213 RepID=A0ABT0PJ51_9GAMM|nr:phosphotransferase [Sansalvadorimonas sp. 2012CJ34-2]MCL6271261.1 aminoglycoside phosphotransferase family protein [Sansalvadorimonas sp. 2012CJ34-2]
MPEYRATHNLLLEAEETFSTGLIDCSTAKEAIACLAQFHNDMINNLPVDKDLSYGRYRDHALPLLETIPVCCRLVGKFEEEGYSQKLASQLRTLLPEAVHYWNSQIRPQLKEERNVTVIHGDCFWHHFWVPKAKGGSMMLFDFDLATVHNPVWDLVTLLSTRRPEGLSTSDAITCYRKHSRLRLSQEDVEKEFAWLSLCQIYHVLADWNHGCREVIWSQRLNNLLQEIPNKLKPS